MHCTAYMSISAHGRAGGAGNSLFLGIGERAGSIGTYRCGELLAILRVRIVRNLSAEYLPPTQQQRYTPDVDQRKSPERTIGRRTSSSDHACPAPHCGKTPRLPAPHVPARATSTRVHVAGLGTRPTYVAHPRCQAPPPRTHAATQTPSAHPRRTCAPRTQERPERTRTPHAPSRSPETRFSAYVRRAHATLTIRSLPVHMAWAIGCLGMDRRGAVFHT